MITVLFQKAKPEAIIPECANPLDAGMDFQSVEKVVILPHQHRLVPFGLRWEPQWEWGDCGNTLNFLKNHFKIYMRLASRSGLSLKKGIEVGAGVVDEDYRGDLGAVIYNHSDEEFVVEKGDKIAQGIVYIVPKIAIAETAWVTNTIRAEGGFGSTGI